MKPAQATGICYVVTLCAKVSCFPCRALRREPGGVTVDRNNGLPACSMAHPKTSHPTRWTACCSNHRKHDSPLPEEFEKQEIDDHVEPGLQLLQYPKAAHPRLDQLQQAPVTKSNKKDSEETFSLLISNNRVSTASSKKALPSEERKTNSTSPSIVR